ncbi:MAG: type transport system ATP-binding protein [Solirubrobacteraceae bacterium]|nr:type transport system ATP-binding protein [Solirubrobacteraceae bacterium]
MLPARLRAGLVALGLAALLGPSAARANVVETPVSIAASMPDDEGNPVTLDGGVDVPDAGCPCPAVIINHGFLGNWTNGGDDARRLAAHGYVVLRYSSRGFGKTPGEVDLMGPKERQDLLDAVHWLNNPASPVVGGKVVHNDIGQYGGSYGGAHAWALAMANDPAVRTVVPTATWTDIYDALLPNDVELLAYTNGFYATGLSTGAGLTDSHPYLATTDNYSQEMHRWVAEANTGVNTKDLEAGAAARSVKDHYADINIPVFIIQGTNDGLFSQNQALDAYQALHRNGTPVRLYVGGIGHPPSNSDTNSPEAQHLQVELLAWFDHYLKGKDTGIDRMPPIEYSHADYFDNTWNGKTVSARSYPFGPAQELHLCTSGPAGGTLSAQPCPSAVPAPVLDVPSVSGLDEEPVTASYAHDFEAQFAAAFGQRLDFADAPGGLSYDGAPLSKPYDMVGVPSLHLQVASADQLPAGLKGGAAAFQLDPKFFDVDADGHAKLITRGAFAEPLDALAAGTTPQHRVDFDAFGSSYTIPAGHHLRITLNSSDAPYLRPTPNPFAAVLFAGSTVDLPSGADMFPTPPIG